MNDKSLVSGRVTQKGQVTIPIELRNRLNIQEGDRLEFKFVDNLPVINVIKKTDLEDVFGSLKLKSPVLNFETERKVAKEALGEKWKNGQEDD
ncbi:AbrB/MazE/SpoVT family DNA-binding domain-containing protein [Bacillus sp. 03113]|uniref:AbrB/MazE/SpoVT family DNA-binding domain-containing protein n=1 Tax=Bacillus sp. 03113 TaxID=2578211 RepID=UPI0015E8C029|nr:AbrB/MazE/SpoVT family DNA-binding domain-containing protein [Bacillus sp. 03113]